MGVKISGKYVGNKKIELIHEPSGARILTSAPVDNQGDGSSFSPTDLLAGSLGACMMTIIAILGERDGVDLTGMRMEVEKEMAQNPRRIGRLPLSIHLPKNLEATYREKLERAAKTCPVHHSLLPEIEVQLQFLYDIG